MVDITELPINSLEYEEIRNNLVTFLNQQVDAESNPVYADYDFAASGISTLLNILAYHTHYLGYYMKMVLNESFIDSAVKRESLYSKAKLTGYLPRGKTASKVEVVLTVDIPVDEQPSARSILVPAGTTFSGVNYAYDTRSFFNVDDVYIDDITVNGATVTYTSEPIQLSEGAYRTWNFVTDTTLLNQRYVIKDTKLDLDTLRVYVTPYGATSGEFYTLAENALTVEANSKVYYLTTNEDALYEIIFGNNQFGMHPSNQSTITVTYIAANGESGNGCREFSFNAPSEGSVPLEHNISYWEDMVVTPNGLSTGGAEAETIASMRHTIPHHWRRQERLVTADDYRSILISEFRNIDSINVWGGETNDERNYGKIYISIKPKFNDRLTVTAKRDIERRILESHAVIGMQPVFVDPEFVDINITVYAKVDRRRTIKTFGELESEIIETVETYNDDELNTFDNFFSEVDLMDQIRSLDPAIKSAYSKKTIEKSLEIYYDGGIENELVFGNALRTGVRSTTFNYGAYVAYFADDIDDGNIYIYNNATGTKLVITPQGSVDYTNGVVTFIFPTFATLVENDYGNAGIIKFTATPDNPDIETFLQNIIRIAQIRVVISDV